MCCDENPTPPGSVEVVGESALFYQIVNPDEKFVYELWVPKQEFGEAEPQGKQKKRT